jgi:hypothetical protein
MNRETTLKPRGESGPDTYDDPQKGKAGEDTRSQGAGEANAGTGVKPSSSPNRLERGDYPEPGEDTGGGGGHNHRVLPTPSKEAAGPIGRRGTGNVRGVVGEGRGSSGKFRGTMGDGANSEPPYKGTMGS